MKITVKDIDKTLKRLIREDMTTSLLRRDRKLPLPKETDIILSIVDESLISKYEKMIKDYYEAYFETTLIEPYLTADDCLAIYLNAV